MRLSSSGAAPASGPRLRLVVGAVALSALTLLGGACGHDESSSVLKTVLAGSVDPNGDYAEIRGRLQDSTSRCMRRAGFAFDAASALPLEVASGSEELPAIVGNGASARYSDTPSVSTGGDGDQAAPTESPEYLHALLGPDTARRRTIQLPEFGEFGTGTQGCLADAYNEVIGERLAFKWQTTEFIVRNLVAPLVASARDDDAVVAAIRSWRACMSQAGYSVATPVAAFAASADDAAIAVDDLVCRSSSNLTSAWKSALERAAKDLDSDLEPYLVFWRDTNAAILERTG